MTENKPIKILMHTTEGDVTLMLYDDTPLHRDNFVKLAKEGFYDGTLFHRVINDFMVQAGDPDSKNAAPGARLGSGDPGYTIPAEIVYPRHFHKRGALAAARQGDQVNPERRSSGSQFYIVTGQVVDSMSMQMMQQRMEHQMLQEHFNQLAKDNWTQIQHLREIGDREALQSLQTDLEQQTIAWGKAHPFTFPPQVIEAYTTVGGTPHLDNQYTVFGEVVSGMDIVDKIQKTRTDAADRPVDDIKIISMQVLDD